MEKNKVTDSDIKQLKKARRIVNKYYPEIKHFTTYCKTNGVKIEDLELDLSIQTHECLLFKRRNK